MATAIHSARPLGGGRWKVSGIVDHEPRAVTFELDGEPTIGQCEAALRGERVQRVLREPALPPMPQEGPGAHPATPPAPPSDPDVAALLEGNVAAVSERVASGTDRDLLERALAAEEAGAGRKTALGAIAARIEQLIAELA